VRRVPQGKFKQFPVVVYFRLKIFTLFVRLLSKEFGRADHLKQHVFAIHRKEKPFQCDVCSKVGFNFNAFLDSENLYSFAIVKLNCIIVSAFWLEGDFTAPLKEPQQQQREREKGRIRINNL